MWDSVKYGSCGCGATALGLITGDNPFQITNQKHLGEKQFLHQMMDGMLK